MDLIKKLTGKNPSEYEPVAQSLVDNSDVVLFEKLVSQDDFLFDFIKNNVAKRIQKACNKENYLNLLNFLNIYSPYYDTMIAEVLHNFGGETIFAKMKELFLNGNNSQKAYALKYFTFADSNMVKELLPEIRNASKSDIEMLSANAIEVLSLLNDQESKEEALKKLDSEDEFEQYEGIKFLVAFNSKESLPKIIEVMKKSGLSENIASEIPYLVPLSELLNTDYENGLLVIAHILNSIPEILPLSVVCDYDLNNVFQELLSKEFDSISALILRMAKDKFEEFISNDEYLFDSDKNTKDAVNEITRMLKPLNNNKLNSLLYDELYEESDFVFFAVDYVNEPEELETLLESSNQTLILKVLTILKEKELLTQNHKDMAMKSITNIDIKNIAEAL
ncbi:MAG: hypothetical protein MJ230_00325 [bacterium]|nr:hypothetical protein [bacterium]